LKQSYRDALISQIPALNVRFILLDVSRAVLEERLNVSISPDGSRAIFERDGKGSESRRCVFSLQLCEQGFC
jgi:hypothetical protein